MGKDRFRPGGSKDKGPKFVKLDHWMLNTAAWRDLDPVARALYIELRQRYNGSNNGTIGLGTREACAALHIGRTTVQRAFEDLISHGFIQVTRQTGFGQTRMTREWLLTSEKDDRNGQLSTKDFVRWKPTDEKSLGPSQDRIGPSQDRSFPSTPARSVHRSSGGPMEPKTIDLQARMGTTYRSTIGRAS